MLAADQSQNIQSQTEIQEHTHSEKCWHSLERECIEFRMRELESEIIRWRGLAVAAQAALRQTKGIIDKIEGRISRAIAAEK